jgi:pimeloyl-ACP methyl ester carboxylesterase
MVAQVAALDHPEAFSALTLVGTRPVASGPVDDDLPDHDAAKMDRLFLALDASGSRVGPRCLVFRAFAEPRGISSSDRASAALRCDDLAFARSTPS